MRKTRWLLVRALGLLLLCIAPAACAVPSTGGTLQQPVSDGTPFEIDLRPLPTGRTPATVLPKSAGAFKRDGVRGDDEQGQAEYRSGSAIFRVTVARMDSSREARGAVAECVKTLEAQGNTVQSRSDQEPTYATAGEIICWNRSRYFFAVEPVMHTSPDLFELFMWSFRY